MCKGPNQEVIDYLKADKGIVEKVGIKVDFDFIMQNIKGTGILPELRSKLIQLLKGRQLIHVTMHAN